MSLHNRQIQELEAQVKELEEALEYASNIFRQYQALHKAKDTVEGDRKAIDNQHHADFCDKALSK